MCARTRAQPPAQALSSPFVSVSPFLRVIPFPPSPPSSHCPQRQLHRDHEPIPALRLLLQPATAGCGEAVVLGSAVVVRSAPFGLEQTLVLEPIQRGVERALLDRQRLVRDLLNAQQHAVAVQLAERNRLEDEK